MHMRGGKFKMDYQRLEDESQRIPPMPATNGESPFSPIIAQRKHPLIILSDTDSDDSQIDGLDSPCHLTEVGTRTYDTSPESSPITSVEEDSECVLNYCSSNCLQDSETETSVLHETPCFNGSWPSPSYLDWTIPTPELPVNDLEGSCETPITNGGSVSHPSECNDVEPSTFSSISSKADCVSSSLSVCDKSTFPAIAEVSCENVEGYCKVSCLDLEDEGPRTPPMAVRNVRCATFTGCCNSDFQLDMEFDPRDYSTCRKIAVCSVDGESECAENRVYYPMSDNLELTSLAVAGADIELLTSSQAKECVSVNMPAADSMSLYQTALSSTTTRTTEISTLLYETAMSNTATRATEISTHKEEVTLNVELDNYIDESSSFSPIITQGKHPVVIQSDTEDSDDSQLQEQVLESIKETRESYCFDLTESSTDFGTRPCSASTESVGTTSVEDGACVVNRSSMCCPEDLEIPVVHGTPSLHKSWPSNSYLDWTIATPHESPIEVCNVSSKSSVTNNEILLVNQSLQDHVVHHIEHPDYDDSEKENSDLRQQVPINKEVDCNSDVGKETIPYGEHDSHDPHTKNTGSMSISDKSLLQMSSLSMPALLDIPNKSTPISAYKETNPANQSLQDSLDQSACSLILAARRKRLVLLDSETETSDNSMAMAHTVDTEEDCNSDVGKETLSSEGHDGHDSVPRLSGCTKTSLDPCDKSDPLSTHQDQSVQDSLDQSACSPILVSRRKRPVFIDSETEDSDSSATRLHTVSDKIGHLDRSPYSPVLEAPHKHPVFTVSEKEASKPIAATSTFLETVLNSWSLQGCLNQSLYSPTVGETEDPDLSAARMQAIDKGEICNLVSGQGSPDGHDRSDSVSPCSPIIIAHRKRPVFIDNDSEDSDHSPTRLQPAKYEEVEREVLLCEGPICLSEDDENDQDTVNHESGCGDLNMKLVGSQNWADKDDNGQSSNPGNKSVQFDFEDRDFKENEGGGCHLKPRKSVHFDCDDEDNIENDGGLVHLMNDLSIKPTPNTKPMRKPGNKENIPRLWETGFRTPMKSPFPGLQTPSHTPFRTPLSALSSSEPGRKYNQYRNDMVSDLRHVFNETVFDNQLPSDLEITWNKRLTKTAGQTVSTRKKDGQCVARIVLSDKVCDRYDRLRDTLIHEMCHAATWLINGHKHEHHGPQWQLWTQKAMKAHPELPQIKRCHSYEIHKKYTYKCTYCLYTVGRHSKMSAAKCPHCGSLIELMPKMRKDGTPAQPRALNRWLEFVNKNRDQVRLDHPGISQKALMQYLSAQYNELKEQKDEV